jgi:hypothetical protein
MILPSARSTRSPSFLRILVLTIAISLMTASVAGAAAWRYSGWGAPSCTVHSGPYWVVGHTNVHTGDAWGSLYNWHVRAGTNVRLTLRAKALAWNSYGYGHISVPWNTFNSNLEVKHDCGVLACKYIGCQVSLWN